MGPGASPRRRRGGCVYRYNRGAFSELVVGDFSARCLQFLYSVLFCFFFSSGASKVDKAVEGDGRSREIFVLFWMGHVKELTISLP